MKLSICVKELGIVKRLAASVRRAVTLIVVRRTSAFGVTVAFTKALVWPSDALSKLDHAGSTVVASLSKQVYALKFSAQPSSCK